MQHRNKRQCTCIVYLVHVSNATAIKWQTCALARKCNSHTHTHTRAHTHDHSSSSRSLHWAASKQHATQIETLSNGARMSTRKCQCCHMVPQKHQCMCICVMRSSSDICVHFGCTTKARPLQLLLLHVTPLQRCKRRLCLYHK